LREEREVLNYHVSIIKKKINLEINKFVLKVGVRLRLFGYLIKPKKKGRYGLGKVFLIFFCDFRLAKWCFEVENEIIENYNVFR
jgi:hypothetical protein